MDAQSFISYQTTFIFVVLGIIWYFRKTLVYGVYQKYSAWLLILDADYLKEGLKDEKDQLFRCLREYGYQKKEDLKLLEIGSGPVANLAYFPPSAKVVCLEPNPNFAAKARENVKNAGYLETTDFVQGYAEDMPFEDESFDIVVCTLVLCSVDDLKKCLLEIKRVLKPGGIFIFLEHVANDNKKSWGWMFQRLFNPLTRLIFDGCEVIRDTETYILAAGFSDVKLQKFLIKPLPSIFKPAINGVATK